MELVNIKPKTRQEIAESILAFLNEKTGRRYRPTRSNLKFIYGRLDEGYTEKEIRAVIAIMCRKWGSSDLMRDYLRPKTLFNETNFNNYAGELGEDVS